jgi:2-C-methyl-D-erythritol 4-phosphate cytidylyltransferase
MNSVIIPAAGRSTRMGDHINKQFLKLYEKEVIAYTIDIFYKNPLIDEIILVINEKAREDFNRLINKYAYQGIKVVNGGSSRSISVYKGLLEVSKESKKVLIHDGARPFLKEKYIKEIVDQLDISSSVVMAVKSKDTIKKVDGKHVKETLNRDELINVQTPQAFRYDVILKVYEWAMNNDIQATDDSALVEKKGYKTAVILGDYDNIKITTVEDIKFGEAILKERLTCV